MQRDVQKPVEKATPRVGATVSPEQLFEQIKLDRRSTFLGSYEKLKEGLEDSTVDKQYLLDKIAEREIPVTVKPGDKQNPTLAVTTLDDTAVETDAMSLELMFRFQDTVDQADFSGAIPGEWVEWDDHLPEEANKLLESAERGGDKKVVEMVNKFVYAADSADFNEASGDIRDYFTEKNLLFNAEQFAGIGGSTGVIAQAAGGAFIVDYTHSTSSFSADGFEIDNKCFHLRDIRDQEALFIRVFDEEIGSAPLNLKTAVEKLDWKYARTLRGLPPDEISKQIGRDQSDYFLAHEKAHRYVEQKIIDPLFTGSSGVDGMSSEEVKTRVKKMIDMSLKNPEDHELIAETQSLCVCAGNRGPAAFINLSEIVFGYFMYLTGREHRGGRGHALARHCLAQDLATEIEGDPAFAGVIPEGLESMPQKVIHLSNLEEEHLPTLADKTSKLLMEYREVFKRYGHIIE